MTGNVFGIKGSSGFVEFKVVATIPLPYCVVSPDTLIYCSGTPLKREVRSLNSNFKKVNKFNFSLGRVEDNDERGIRRHRRM